MLGRCINTPPLGDFIEMGSGAGFIKKLAPHVITSDVLPYDGVDLVFSALDIPLQKSSVSAFLMIDVLHHVKDSVRFFEEMQRCLKTGGKIIMVEPANTPWSTFIYTRFHHEPFEPSGEWGFEEGGPLSGANMAIPWIIFCRDRQRFEQEFAQFRIRSISCHTPLRYLLSGGLSVRQLVPSWSYQFIQIVEWLLSPINR
ncbi:MAG: methyltransferase domain-containing protein, partial [bacterium]|nr:methyltransferase domain-containing protein [bacterium]